MVTHKDKTSIKLVNVDIGYTIVVFEEKIFYFPVFIEVILPN